MKSLILACVLFSTVSAFAMGKKPKISSADVPNYGPEYYVHPVWVGEIPNGFTMTATTPLDGHVSPDPKSPTFTCTLPAKATIHPWNEKRVKSDDLKFYTVSKIVLMTAKEDFQAFEGELSFPIKKGAQLEHLIGLGEGVFFYRFKGETWQHEGDEAYFEHLTYEAGAFDFLDDQWVKVKCQEKDKNAWLRYEDVRNVDGVDSVTIDVPGEAKDLP